MKMKALGKNLTPSEQRIVDVIAEDPQKIIYASVAELSSMAGVSDPTVIRFCRKLGLDGYQELKLTLAREIVTPLESINVQITAKDDATTAASKVFSGIIHTLQFTHANLCIPDIEKAAAMIQKARRLIIVGVGNSHAIATDFMHKMMRLDINVTAFSDMHLATIAIANSTEKDVLFCVSHSGSTKEIVDLAVQAKKTGIKIISLTNAGITPLSKNSDITLKTYSEETHYRILGQDSRIAELAIMDSITTLISMHYSDKNFLKIEEALVGHKY